jgi:hypothetical protein
MFGVRRRIGSWPGGTGPQRCIERRSGTAAATAMWEAPEDLHPEACARRCGPA